MSSTVRLQLDPQSDYRPGNELLPEAGPYLSCVLELLLLARAKVIQVCPAKSFRYASGHYNCSLIFSIDSAWLLRLPKLPIALIFNCTKGITECYCIVMMLMLSFSASYYPVSSLLRIRLWLTTGTIYKRLRVRSYWKLLVSLPGIIPSPNIDFDWGFAR